MSQLSAHGISQARIPELIAIFFSRGSYWPRDWTWVSCVADRFFTGWANTHCLLYIPLEGYFAFTREKVQYLSLLQYYAIFIGIEMNQVYLQGNCNLWTIVFTYPVKSMSCIWLTMYTERQSKEPWGFSYFLLSELFLHHLKFKSYIFFYNLDNWDRETRCFFLPLCLDFLLVRHLGITSF